MTPITPEELSTLLYEELQVWERIETCYFECPPKLDDDDSEETGVAGLYEAVESLAARINQKFGV